MILSIEQIQKIIPHRFPFLLIDRVIELNENKVTAIKNISANEKFFQGHFPDTKIMPGVLLVEIMAQTAIILLDYIQNKENYETNNGSIDIRENPYQDIRENPRQKIRGHSRIYYLGSIKAKFLKPTTVGDVLKIEVAPVRLLSNSGIMKGAIFVDSTKIAQAELGISVKQ